MLLQGIKMVRLIKALGLMALLSFPSLFASTQTLSGDVLDESRQKVAVGFIKIYDSGNTGSISEVSTISNGQFRILLRKKYVRMLLVVSANGYNAEHLYFPGLKEGDSARITVVLKQSKSPLLEEVIIRSKQNPITIKNDTTIYKLNAFRDGTERKLEDILRKLPGIDVNLKTGEVRFKGKPIETVLVEGDDLFSGNYTLGTKNISADMVDEVQAIENYSDNYVLKGLEKEEKVALNIRTKKGGFKVSGNADLGLGVFKEEGLLKDFNVNLIGLNNAHKFFTTNSFNNSGQNKSHRDYAGNNISPEQQRERRYFSERFIPESFSTFFVDDKRLNDNNQFFNNYNGLFKVGGKVRVRANLFYTSDEIIRRHTYETEYHFGSDTVYNLDDALLLKKLHHYRADAYVRNNISGKSLLEYTASVRQEDNNSRVDNLSNRISKYNTGLLTDGLFFKQNLLFSQRAGKKNALQFSLIQSSDNAVQNYNIAPSIYKRGLYSADSQSSRYRKNSVLLQSRLIGVFANGNYNFSLNASADQNHYRSFAHSDSNSLRKEYYQNHITYVKSAIYHSGNVGYNFKRWRFNPSYSLIYLRQELSDFIGGSKLDGSDFYFEPNVSISYRPSKISLLRASFSVSQKPDVEQHIFYDYVIQNNRNVRSNIPSLQLERTSQARVNYSLNDLYHQITLNAGAGIEEGRGGYVPFYLITDSILFSQYIFRPVANRSITTDISIGKYIPAILSTVKFSADYALNEYRNVVNASSLRENVFENMRLELFYKSAFRGKMNFENVIAFSAVNANHNWWDAVKSVQNSFKVIARPSKEVFAVLTADYFLPGTRMKNNNNLFMDFDVTYRPNNKKIELRFSGKNLLNNKDFSLFQVTDFSRSMSRTTLLTRNLGLFISFLF
jgi:hypothetical protein